MVIYCHKCKEQVSKEFDESKFDLHHKIPKFMGGTDKDGRVYFCYKCHSILHNIIPSIIWRYIEERKKEDVRIAVKKFTEKFCENKKDDTKTIKKKRD